MPVLPDETKKCRTIIVRHRGELRVQDFLQHLAQPAASPQHLVHVAESLQQPPSHAVAALQDLQLAQPVLNNSPTAQNAPRINSFISNYLSVRAVTLTICRPHSASSKSSIPAREASKK